MIEIFDLKRGSHKDASWGTCAMEVVAWLAGEKHSDKPLCACPVIGKFVILGNDMMDHKTRQHLKVFIPRILGSRDPANERRRAEHLAWAAVTVFAPMALAAAGLHDHARQLREFDKSLGLKAVAHAAAKAVYAANAAVYAANAADVADVADAAAKAVYAANAAKAAKAANAAKAVYAANAADVADVADAAAKAVYAANAAKAAKAANAAKAVYAANAVWDAYFAVLDEVLNLGTQGSNDYDFALRVDAFRTQVLESA